MVLSTILVFVPVLGVAIVFGPVARFNLFLALKRPIDGGRSWRGKRIFGDNKTWRGALAMFVGVAGLAWILAQVPAFWRQLPSEIQRAGPWLYGSLLGLGTVAGELPNSFIKRRLGIAPGTRRRSVAGSLITVFDQGDIVVGIWATLLPIWVMPPGHALLAFAAVSVVHVAISAISYAIGVRKTVL